MDFWGWDETEGCGVVREPLFIMSFLCSGVVFPVGMPAAAELSLTSLVDIVP